MDKESRRRIRLLWGNIEFPLANRLEFTNAGVTCHVSHNNSSHNQFGKTRYRFYCGRQVGTNGYHNRCTLCDGRCGPDNGCQCTTCYALEMIVQGCQPPFTNATSTATAIATTLYRPPSRIMPSSLIDSEIASFTTLHHCEHFQSQLEHWKSLLRAKRVSSRHLSP